MTSDSSAHLRAVTRSKRINLAVCGGDNRAVHTRARRIRVRVSGENYRPGAGFSARSDRPPVRGAAAFDVGVTGRAVQRIARPRPVPLLPVRMAPLVVESERVERAVLHADVDLPQAAPHAPRRRGCRHRLAAVPQPLAGRAVVRVKNGRQCLVPFPSRQAGRQREDDAVDDERCGRRGEVVRDPAGSSESAPPASINFSATTAPAETGPLAVALPADSRPLAGSRIHDVPDRLLPCRQGICAHAWRPRRRRASTPASGVA